ncbi:zymogen granule membrane protein 16-like [Gouania willdenowi]|uniref:zymogen granule membrane protein 16-like n=1 Tax=Gouania willdenowi TaxID=441366 RepID=UPI0010562451|nr:zymogen granule membrane protein 16-like [Gouania willdenowi]XP_028317430.1 zymogen granule membrane protein 16-like [Gouania willdenowi]
MLFVAVLTLLALSALADDFHDPEYSFVAPVGPGSGTAFSLTGEGRITAIRVWEWSGSYIVGFQFRYGVVWSEVVGRKEGESHEMELFDGEAIVQISGKYTSYIQSVVFITNMGRSLNVGRPSGHSFNMYPTNKHAELCFISGRYHSGISSLGSHWALVNPSTDSTMNNQGEVE